MSPGRALHGAWSVACAALALAACPALEYPRCENDDPCQRNGEVCVYGQCLRCALDTHCPADQRCRRYKCEPRPVCTVDADCKDGRVCRHEQCELECIADEGCAAGMRCDANRCTQALPACVEHPDCDPGQQCAGGWCTPISAEDPAFPAVQESQAAALRAARSAVDVDAAPLLCGGESRVLFGYNLSALDDVARKELARVAECLSAPGAPPGVVLRGHADERGSTEYNVALAERRALAVRLVLRNLGVAVERMTVLPLGEERPLDPGHDEVAWARNRRVDLVPRAP